MPKPNTAPMPSCDLPGCVVGCQDHLHDRAYHSADCGCGRTEADCPLG